MREKINFLRELTEIVSFLGRCLMLVSLYNCVMYVYRTENYMSNYVALEVCLIALPVMLVAFVALYGSIAYLEHKFWPKPLTGAIKSNHGKDLTTVMKRLRTESIEYRAIFNTKGRKLTEGTLSSPNICNVPQTEWNRIYQVGLIDLHNHPDVEQTSFSDQDLYSMIYLKTQRDIVVTRSFTYIMENPYWNREDGPTAESVKAYAAHLYGGSKGHYNFQVISMALFTRTHSWYVSYKTAKKFGLKYRIESLRVQRIRALFRRTFATPRRIAMTTSFILAAIITIRSIATAIFTVVDDNADSQAPTVIERDIDWSSLRASRESVIPEHAIKPQYTLRKDDNVLEVDKTNPADGVFQPDRPVRVDAVD